MEFSWYKDVPNNVQYNVECFSSFYRHQQDLRNQKIVKQFN